MVQHHDLCEVWIRSIISDYDSSSNLILGFLKPLLIKTVAQYNYGGWRSSYLSMLSLFNISSHIYMIFYCPKFRSQLISSVFCLPKNYHLPCSCLVQNHFFERRAEFIQDCATQKYHFNILIAISYLQDKRLPAAATNIQ